MNGATEAMDIFLFKKYCAGPEGTGAMALNALSDKG